MRNFFLIKHHPRGLTEAYQENSCRTHAPRHTLPAFAGRHDDENLISLTRPSVNNPNPIMQSERVVLGEQAIVSKKGGILLANPEISFYCTIKRSLVDSTKINNKIRMAGVSVHSDVCCEAYFLAICYKNYLCSIK